MKNKKTLFTIFLIFIASGSLYLAIRTYGALKERINPENGKQMVMIAEGPMDTPAPTPTLIPTPLPSYIMTPEMMDGDVNFNDGFSPDSEAAQQAAEPGAPELTLMMDVVELSVGDSINEISFIEELVDDNTDRATLFSNVEIHGSYDSTQPGDYTLEYVVSDSEGKYSIPKYLTIKVR